MKVYCPLSSVTIWSSWRPVIDTVMPGRPLPSTVTMPMRLAVRTQAPAKFRVTLWPDWAMVTSAVVASKLASAGRPLIVMV